MRATTLHIAVENPAKFGKAIQLTRLYIKYGISRQLNSVIRNSRRAVGTSNTFHPLDLIDIIMSRYSIVIDAFGSITDETVAAEAVSDE